MATAQNIYDLAQDLHKVDGSTYGIPAFEEDRVVDWINWLRDDFFTRTELFRRTTVNRMADATALSVAYTGGDTTMSLDSVTGFNGAFVINSGTNQEIGEHSGTSGSDLSNVSNVNLDYAIDTEVRPLLKLPDNIISIHQLELNGTTTEYEEIRIENNRFLFTTASGSVHYKYSYRPDALTAISDDVKIDNPFHYYLVYGLLKIWKEVDENTQDTSREEQRMLEIAQQAVSKQLQGKKLKVTSFSRYRG